MKIAIYGLMLRSKCLYVGQTSDPLAREYRWKKDKFFSRIKFVFKILEWATPAKARSRERFYVGKYRAIGQAQHNVHLCSAVDFKVANLKPGKHFIVKTANERWQALRMSKLLGKKIITKKIKAGFTGCLRPS